MRLHWDNKKDDFFKKYLRIEPYNPEWESIAFNKIKAIKEKLSGVSWFKDIQHIGSTSIPGMSAKPVIDLVIGYDEYDPTVNKFSIEYHLNLLGYKVVAAPYLGDNSLDDYGVYIYVVPYKSLQWNGRLVFRDHFLKNPNEIEDYCSLKRRMINKGLDFFEYVRGKRDYIVQIFLNEGWSMEEIDRGMIVQKRVGKLELNFNCPMIVKNRLNIFIKTT